MAEHKVKVLGFGDNVVDMYEHSHMMYPGGNCVNLCAYSKIFGVERAAYMGYFGNGDRIFGDYNQGGVRGKTPYVLDRFDLAYMKEFDFVHTGNYCYTESQLSKMKEAGIKVSFDFSDDSSKEYYETYAPYVTYAFCSFDGTDEEAKEHLKFIHSLGPELVSLTRGSKGCIMYDGEQFYVQPAKLIDHVVDTMGAGDSFLTSFMDSYMDGLHNGVEKSEAIRKALQDAAEFAANVCQMEGAFGYGTPYED